MARRSGRKRKMSSLMRAAAIRCCWAPARPTASRSRSSLGRGAVAGRAIGRARSKGRATRITSVPYALRSADADTLGGRPASAYCSRRPTSGERTTATTAGPAVSERSSRARPRRRRRAAGHRRTPSPSTSTPTMSAPPRCPKPVAGSASTRGGASGRLPAHQVQRPVRGVYRPGRAESVQQRQRGLRDAVL